MKVSLLMALLSLLSLLSCASTELPLTDTGEVLRLEEDERRLWKRSQEEQQRLDSSDALYTDAFWVAYVNDVSRRLIPPEAKGQGLHIEIRLIRNPLLNAFTYPNGIIYVHTGILARMENEAQLATLLAHEMTHALHRHAVQNMRSLKNTTAVLASFQIITLPFGLLGSLAQVLGAVGAMASVTGYSQELETDADRHGLDLMVQAGYEPSEAPKLFAHLKKDLEEQKVQEPFFFGTHPRLQERIDSYRALLEQKYASKKGQTGAERFNQRLLPLILDTAQLDLAMGRFPSVERGLGHALEQEPRNPTARYLLGELYRQRAQEGDYAKAETAYDLAAEYDAGYAEPHKGLGLLAYKKGLREKASLELSLYLGLAPEAKDRLYIEEYIHDLTSRGQR